MSSRPADNPHFDPTDPDAPATPLEKGAEESVHLAARVASASPIAARTVEVADTREQVQPGVSNLTVEIADTYEPPVSVVSAGSPVRAHQTTLNSLSGATFAQYELIRELDRGGMSTVFLARDVRLGRRVAIKFLAQKDAAWADRFKAEARATARCTHDNIVVIYDVGEAFGRLYLALEYLEGVTLRAWLEERREGEGAVVPPARAAEIMIPVVRALAHAHGQGLVHRDLKPDNIMLVESGSIKVLDFGVAKALDNEDRSSAVSGTEATAKQRDPDQPLERMFETRAGTVVGTLPYMSPEQWGADRIDERSDLWAVGIMLWEMVTGEHPLNPVSRRRLQSVEQLDLPMPRLSDIRPDLGAVGSIVDSCLRKHKDERVGSASALLTRLERLVRAAQSSALEIADNIEEPANPFAGLAAFQEADASRFFGREQDVASILAQLRNRPLVAVSGPSGAGKSSFVRAGLVPALRRSGRAWTVVIARPGRQPLSALAAALDPLVERADDSRAETDEQARGRLSEPASGVANRLEQAAAARRQLIDTLSSQPGYLGAALRAHARRAEVGVLLFIDQFEELYTLVTDPADRRAFLECLEGVADDASSPLRVVLTLRSDFLDRVAEDRAFSSELTRGLSLLAPLGREQLRQAMSKPLAAVGYRFEDDEMVEQMLDSLQSTRSPLPLMQFTASKLWELRDTDKKVLSRASQEQLGGIAGALSTHAEAVLASMSSKEQRLARSVVLALVTEERTRAVVEMSDLRALTRDRQAVDRVVRQLADARLVLIETDAEHGSTVELSHESLIDRWPRLGQWLADDHEAGRFRALLRAAAREWHKQGRSDDLLWRGRAAEDARRWLARLRRRAGSESELGDTPLPGGAPSTLSAADIPEIGTRDQQFLEAVVALAERARRRRRRVIGLGFAFLSAIAVLVSLLAVHASREADRAERQAARAEAQAAQTRSQAARADREAEKARAEAVQARNATRMAYARGALTDPTTVLALVREIEPGSKPRGWSELARWALRNGVAQVVVPHADIVNKAAFSPDGTRVVTASSDGIVRIWRADGSGAPVELAGHEGSVDSAVFSPDGTLVASASADKTARIWRVADARDDRISGAAAHIVLRGHEERLYRAVFSPDGQRVVTASADGTARIFSTAGEGEGIVLRGHVDRVYDAAFSPDGTRVATASGDRSARIVTLDGSRPPRVLRGHEHRVYAVAFSPDGAHVITASGDKTARIWSVLGSDQGEDRPVVVSGHEDRVYTAAFSPDGERVVTASMDRSVRITRADGTGAPVVLRGHRGRVQSAAFSPDGRRIVSASDDRTARIWRTESSSRPLVFSQHRDRVYSASFSPDGGQVVSASADRSARVWRTDGRGQAIVLRGHTDRLYGASFSPDGTRIVTASGDRSARIFSVEGDGPVQIFGGHGDRVYGAVFSPDGRRIATASGDKIARIFTIDGNAAPVALKGHEDRVYGVAFSPDGQRLITASGDNTARIWNADGSGAPTILRGHTDRVNWAAFGPDGTRVATGSWDKSARIWNADGSGQPLVLRGHEAAVGVRGGRAFSPDGARLVTHSDDKTIRVWDAHTGAPLLVLRGPEAPINSAAFDPSGTRIVSAHGDNTAWLWTDLSALTDVGDPRLWTATNYCMPVALRMRALDFTEAVARADHQRCRARVARVHDESSKPAQSR